MTAVRTTASTNTWSIWVLALLPLVGIATTLLQDPAGQMRRAVEVGVQQAEAAQRGVSVVPTPAVTVGTALSWVLALVLLAVQVLLAVHDQRALRRLGVERPFPWGWAFLNPVYIIGRHVVVRRRVHGSLAPLWLWIVTTVVAVVVVASVFVAAIVSAIGAAGLS